MGHASRLTSLAVGLALGLTTSAVAPAGADGAPPPLAEYFTAIGPKAIAPDYAPRFVWYPTTADLDGDGNEDLIVLGVNYALPGEPVKVPQPGLVFLGDGNGNFAPAPSTLFPVDTLNTVNPRKVLFADFNGDGRLDMFVASHGWDTQPYTDTGEQNRLFLSRADGGWRDATAELPQLIDFSHAATFGDIRGSGAMDIVVINYFAPPPQHVLSYALLNNGSGQFTLSRSIIPVATGQTMNSDSGNYSPGGTLTDLNRDGRPDLVVLGDATDASKKLRHTTILWNRAGGFNDADKTALPEPAAFATHIDLDVQAIDVNGDGLPDLVIVGSQGQPFYDGWFVQILLNRGDGTFVDVTADRLAPGDRFGGVPDVATGARWPVWVKVLDFNGDGFPDFAVEYYPTVDSQYRPVLPPDTPLIYLNDGTGHFSTLRVGDFVRPGDEHLIGGGHLMRTRNGYSFVSFDLPPWLPRQGLVLRGLLASKPFRLRRPDPPVSFNVQSSGSSVALTWAAPESGSAPGGYVIEAGSAPGLSDLANGSTGNTSTAYFATGVAAGRYFVRVRSVNLAGKSAPSDEVVHVVGNTSDGCSAPPAPPSLDATVSGSTVTMSWTASAGARSYVLEAGSASGQSDIASINVGATPRLVANGIGAGTYYVRVVAGNSCGTGAPSMERVVTVR